MQLPLGIIGLYLRHSLEETPAFQQHVESLKAKIKPIFKTHQKSQYVKSQLSDRLDDLCWLSYRNNVTLMLLTYMPRYLSHNLSYSTDHGVPMYYNYDWYVICSAIIGLTSESGRRHLLLPVVSV